MAWGTSHAASRGFGRQRVANLTTSLQAVEAELGEGFAVQRIPLSGSVSGRFAGDVVLPFIGRDLSRQGHRDSRNSIRGWTDATC